MGKIYEAATNINGQSVHAQTPIDDRFVVQFRGDLLTANTWTFNNDETVCTYHGMIVTVVGDSSNNGVYMLPRRNKYNKQNWDSSAANWDDENQGWRRIDGAGQSSGSVSMDDLQFDGTGSQASPYYLSNIDGGEISNDSNQIINNNTNL